MRMFPLPFSPPRSHFLSGLLIIGPDSNCAPFVYSNGNRVDELSLVHQRISITLRGRSLRIERTENLPRSLYPGPLRYLLELWNLLDPAKQTVTKRRGMNYRVWSETIDYRRISQHTVSARGSVSGGMDVRHPPTSTGLQFVCHYLSRPKIPLS
jgi:hypothetical protein